MCGGSAAGLRREPDAPFPPSPDAGTGARRFQGSPRWDGRCPRSERSLALQGLRSLSFWKREVRWVFCHGRAEASALREASLSRTPVGRTLCLPPTNPSPSFPFQGRTPDLGGNVSARDAEPSAELRSAASSASSGDSWRDEECPTARARPPPRFLARASQANRSRDAAPSRHPVFALYASLAMPSASASMSAWRVNGLEM